MKKIIRNFDISLKLITENCIEANYSLLFDDEPVVTRKMYWVLSGAPLDIQKPPVFDNGVVYAILTTFGYDPNKELNELIDQLGDENSTIDKTFPFIEKK